MFSLPDGVQERWTRPQGVQVALCHQEKGFKEHAVGLLPLACAHAVSSVQGFRNKPASGVERSGFTPCQEVCLSIEAKSKRAGMQQTTCFKAACWKWTEDLACDRRPWPGKTASAVSGVTRHTIAAIVENVNVCVVLTK